MTVIPEFSPGREADLSHLDRAWAYQDRALAGLVRVGGCLTAVAELSSGEPEGVRRGSLAAADVAAPLRPNACPCKSASV